MQKELYKVKWIRIKANNPLGKRIEALIIRETQIGLMLDAGRAGVGILRRYKISKASKYMGIDMPNRGYIQVVVDGYDEERMWLEFSIPEIENKEESLIKLDPANNGDMVKIRCRVIAHRRNGFFTLLENGIDGFLPVDEVPVSKEHLKPEQILYVDDILDALVTKVDYDKDLAFLSITKLWETDNGKISPSISHEFKPPKVAEDRAVKSYKDYKYGEKRCLLVLEHDEEDIDIIKSFLSQQGHIVFNAFNLDEAFELLLKHKFDCIVSDFKFNEPNLDGIEFCRKINEKYTAMPFIFFTRFIDEIGSAKIMNSGMPMLGILIKYAELNTLGEIVATLKAYNPKTKSKNLGEPKIDIKDIDQEYYTKCYDKAQFISPGIKMAVFRRNPMSKDYEFVFSKGIDPENYRSIAYDVKYSPINDVILWNNQIYVQDVREDTGFKKIRDEKNARVLTDFNCFIGFPLQIMEKREYGLFFFHEQEHAFDHDIGMELLRMAHELAINMERARLSEKIMEERNINQILTILPTMLHELSKNLYQHKLTANRIDTLLRTKSDNDTLANESEIISDLLSFFREQADDLIDVFDGYLMNLRSGTSTFKISVYKLLDNIIKSLRHTIADIYNVSLLSENMDDLLTHISLEPRRLYHALMNILLNAFYHTREARERNGKIIISASYEPSDRMCPVKIRIRDNGIGIHYDDINQIFQPYYSTKPQGEGSGLGLYIAKVCIEEMGGKLWVEDTAMYSGTTFLIELPEMGTRNV